jgi:alpha-tubulin suppressor-like RCC1 family protein
VGVVGISTAIDVAAGDTHTCAIVRPGRAMCWGDNRHGELGDGTTEQRLRPAWVRFP